MIGSETLFRIFTALNLNLTEKYLLRSDDRQEVTPGGINQKLPMEGSIPMRLEENPAAVRIAPIKATARQGETPAKGACPRHRLPPRLMNMLRDPE